jgi:uncharacterized damage-inducible protein DinB
MGRTPHLALLLEIIDQAYDRKSWHGTTLRGSVRGVSLSEASWRPAPGRNTIHELVLHAAYWKYAVRRQLTGAAHGTFPIRGSNWFRRDAATAREWRDSVKLLDAMHEELRKAVVEAGRGDLSARAGRSRYSKQFLISGVAAHDLYHAGQIQLLKRLRRQQP